MTSILYPRHIWLEAWRLKLRDWYGCTFWSERVLYWFSLLLFLLDALLRIISLIESFSKVYVRILLAFGASPLLTVTLPISR